MLLVPYVTFLFLCAVTLANTEPSTGIDKFEEQLATIDRKLNQLISHINAVDRKVEQIQADCRKGQSGENVTPLTLSSAVSSKTAPVLSIPQQAENDLQKLSSQIATLATSSEKRLAQLECRIHEQLKTITDRAKRALLDAKLAPAHECQLEWTVFQQRFDGSVDFYRNWTEYQHGFGDRDGEFWLGLDQLSALLSTGRHELRVQLESFTGQLAYALYDDFQVGNATEKYQLKSVGKYSGTAGDTLSDLVGMNFSTYDADNDRNKISNCAKSYFGAWWYRSCAESNLNGLHERPSLVWNGFIGGKMLKATTMMVRPYSSSRNSG